MPANSALQIKMPGLQPEVLFLRCHAAALVSLPNYGERQREGEPISTAWVESAINEIIAKRMAKSQQMRMESLDGPAVSGSVDRRAEQQPGRLVSRLVPGFRPVDPKVPEPVAA